MLINYTDLLPFRQYSDFDVIQMYSADQTGVGGRFVVAHTGNSSPEDGGGDFAAATPGYNYAGVTNLRYENKRKVRLAQATDNKFSVLGLTLYGTVEFDENGQKIILNPHCQAELGVLYSGQTTPIATDGVFRLKNTAYAGTPLPGSVGLLTGDGKVNFASLSAGQASSGTFNHLIVCKVLSSSGIGFGGGYADIKLMLN